MAGHRIAVVGATGAAGGMTLRILEERKFPVRELRAFASERSVGKSVTFAGESIRVEKVTPEAFRGIEIAFFSAGTAQSKEHAPLAVRAHRNEACVRQDAQMPRHAGLMDARLVDDIAHLALAGAQRLDDAAACRIGQHLENV